MWCERGDLRVGGLCLFCHGGSRVGMYCLKHLGCSVKEVSRLWSCIFSLSAFEAGELGTPTIILHLRSIHVVNLCL